MTIRRVKKIVKISCDLLRIKKIMQVEGTFENPYIENI